MRKRRRYLQSKRPNADERAVPQANLPLLKLSGAAIFRAVGHGREVESRHPMVCVVKATTTPPNKPHPNPHLQQVTESLLKSIVLAKRETARPQKPELNNAAAHKRPSENAKKEAAPQVHFFPPHKGSLSSHYPLDRNYFSS